MAKRQSRRSISVKGTTYQRLKGYCDGKGFAIAGFLEVVLTEVLDDACVPMLQDKSGRPTPSDIPESASQYFTF